MHMQLCCELVRRNGIYMMTILFKIIGETWAEGNKIIIKD